MHFSDWRYLVPFRSYRRQVATRELCEIASQLLSCFGPPNFKGNGSKFQTQLLSRDAGSAKRGIAIVSHPSVYLSVCDVEVGLPYSRIGWVTSNVITWLIIYGLCSSESQYRRSSPRETPQNSGGIGVGSLSSTKNLQYLWVRCFVLDSLHAAAGVWAYRAKMLANPVQSMSTESSRSLYDFTWRVDKGIYFS